MVNILLSLRKCADNKILRITRLFRLFGKDGDGWCMVMKKVLDGVYQWPRRSDEAMALSQEEFKRLMEGFTIRSSIRTYERKTE